MYFKKKNSIQAVSNSVLHGFFFTLSVRRHIFLILLEHQISNLLVIIIIYPFSVNITVFSFLPSKRIIFNSLFQCENKCGLSTETRGAICATAKGEIHPEKFCKRSKLASLSRDCQGPPCEHQWYASQWSQVSFPIVYLFIPLLSLMLLLLLL